MEPGVVGDVDQVLRMVIGVRARDIGKSRFKANGDAHFCAIDRHRRPPIPAYEIIAAHIRHQSDVSQRGDERPERHELAEGYQVDLIVARLLQPLG